MACAGDEQYMLGEDEHIKELDVCGIVQIIRIYTVGQNYALLDTWHSWFRNEKECGA